jgi:phosphonate transport system substrate-binding protein
LRFWDAEERSDMPTRSLSATSLQSPHADAFCRRLTGYLAAVVGTEIRFFDDEPWQAREERLDRGQIDLAWICGLPYARRRDRACPAVSLVAAPVMAAPRYGDRPVYFSDVVVLREGPWRTFDDLRGARWAYNEPTSHSGYALTRFELARGGYGSGFFGRAIEAGSHLAALELLRRGDADATALDSTVLDAMLAERPELGDELRMIATWGPSPIPPWVVARHVPDVTRSRLLQALTSMHLYDTGREVLRTGQTARFTPVDDADYDAIRHMARVAESVTL